MADAVIIAMADPEQRKPVMAELDRVARGEPRPKPVQPSPQALAAMGIRVEKVKRDG